MAATGGRGVASVSVIERAGAAPYTFWIPESADEPAFLAYSITKVFIASLVLKLCEEGPLRLFPVSPRPTIWPSRLHIPMMSQSVEPVSVFTTSSIEGLNSIASTSTDLYWPPVAASSASRSSSAPCSRGLCCQTLRHRLFMPTSESKTVGRWWALSSWWMTFSPTTARPGSCRVHISGATLRLT